MAEKPDAGSVAMTSPPTGYAAVPPAPNQPPPGPGDYPPYPQAYPPGGASPPFDGAPPPGYGAPGYGGPPPGYGGPPPGYGGPQPPYGGPPPGYGAPPPQYGYPQAPPGYTATNVTVITPQEPPEELWWTQGTSRSCCKYTTPSSAVMFSVASYIIGVGLLIASAAASNSGWARMVTWCWPYTYASINFQMELGWKSYECIYTDTITNNCPLLREQSGDTSLAFFSSTMKGIGIATCVINSVTAAVALGCALHLLKLRKSNPRRGAAVRQLAINSAASGVASLVCLVVCGIVFYAYAINELVDWSNEWGRKYCPSVGTYPAVAGFNFLWASGCCLVGSLMVSFGSINAGCVR